MVNQPIDHAISKAKYSEKDQIWGIAWSWKGPQSVRIFRWLVLHNRLKMKAELTRRHIQIGCGCDCCGYSFGGYVACPSRLHGG